jgi:chemotaxis protein histidine kinase CheA
MDNISTEDQETIREFLVESHENLSRLDQDLVELEKHPHDADLLGSIFRTIHTIKGAVRRSTRCLFRSRRSMAARCWLSF